MAWASNLSSLGILSATVTGAGVSGAYRHLIFSVFQFFVRPPGVYWYGFLSMFASF